MIFKQIEVGTKNISKGEHFEVTWHMPVFFSIRYARMEVNEE